ncbi:hypothetical protein OSTOST_12713, partial [Ostertagia ostertagi]
MLSIKALAHELNNTRTVASLPPEKMNQMKELVRSNPSEAKQMLVQNPQLAYALLQAQVVMRIVDPQCLSIKLRFLLNLCPPLPAVSQPGYAVPPQQMYYARPGPPQPPPQPEITPDEQHNAELLVQVMRLTEAEIAMLPPGDREKVIELRNQLRQRCVIIDITDVQHLRQPATSDQSLGASFTNCRRKNIKSGKEILTFWQ